MSISATLPSICAACRVEGALKVEQAIQDGTLTWSETFACSCGHGFEVKNAGLPTPAARAALMAAHGTFRVTVIAVPRGGKALATLSQVLDTPEAEVAQALARLPAVVWEGTRPEADYMSEALGKSGAAIEVDRTAPAKKP